MSSADSQTIRFVFRTLRGRFGNGFVDKFRTDDEKVLDSVTGRMVDPGLLEAMDVWAYELRKLNNADIQHGLTCRFKYPPSADEFVMACCTREFQPPAPEYNPNQLTGPRMSREESVAHMAEVKRAARSMAFPADSARKLDWAFRIAEEAGRGVYRGGMIGKRMAAEAIRDSGKQVPPALVQYLQGSNMMHAANDHGEEAA